MAPCCPCNAKGNGLRCRSCVCVKMNRACSTCAPGHPDRRRCLYRLPATVDTSCQPSSLPISFSAIASTPPRVPSQPSVEVASMPPRVLTSSASTTNSEDSLNDPGQTRATGTQSERTASTTEGLGQAAGTYTPYTGGFRTVDRTEGISEVASGLVNPTCCLNPDATAVPPSLPCLFSGVSSMPRRSLSSGSAENQDGGQATNTGPGPTAGTQESTSDLRGDTPLDVDARAATNVRTFEYYSFEIFTNELFLRTNVR